MKLIVKIIVLICAAAALLSCIQPDSPVAAGPEFAGTWRQIPAMGTGNDTLSITGSAFNQNTNITGMVNLVGTLNVQITSYNEDNNTFCGTITSATGCYSGTSGTMFFRYAVSGNQLSFNYSTTNYPTDTPNGPYTRI